MRLAIMYTWDLLRNFTLCASIEKGIKKFKKELINLKKGINKFKKELKKFGGVFEVFIIFEVFINFWGRNIPGTA